MCFKYLLIPWTPMIKIYMNGFIPHTSLCLLMFSLHAMLFISIQGIMHRSSPLPFLKMFYFVLGYSQLTNNVVIVLGEQQRDSAIYIHVSILPQPPLPSRLPCNIEQSSICYIVGHCWLSILNTAVCRCPSLTVPFSHLPPGNQKFILKVCESVCFESKFIYITSFQISHNKDLI